MHEGSQACEQDLSSGKSIWNLHLLQGAKSGVETVVQGAGALLNKAKDAVSGSDNTAGESQTLAAGRMSQRWDY